MKRWFSFVPLALSAALCACGGGGGYGGGAVAPVTNPVTAGATSLSTATLAGSAGFVNANGMTVYVFDADLPTPNASVCSGACSSQWPTVVGASGPVVFQPFWSTFQRADGTVQLAYKTRALYTYYLDALPGQTNGDGVNAFGGLWHVARP